MVSHRIRQYAIHIILIQYLLTTTRHYHAFHIPSRQIVPIKTTTTTTTTTSTIKSTLSPFLTINRRRSLPPITISPHNHHHHHHHSNHRTRITLSQQNLPHHEPPPTPPTTTSSSSSSPILTSLNPSQITAVTRPLSSITRVVAGPGAGKTRVLTSRVAYLLQETPRRESMLAVTFTKKAAEEMQSRLERVVVGGGVGSDGDEERRRRRQEGVVVWDEDDDDVAVAIMDEPSSTPSSARLLDRVTIGTFHNICARILRWNGSLLSTLPSVIDTIGDDSETNNNVVLDGSFTIVDRKEQTRILKDCFTTKLGISLDKEKEKRSGKVIRPIQILTLISKLTLSADHDNEEGDNTSRAAALAREVYPHYIHSLLSQNALDFDLLLSLAVELLRHSPSTLSNCQKRWTHVLVDEFQDTSRIQLDLIKLLSTKSLFVVGDGNQSIYGWRGANVGGMDDFVEEFGGRGVVETVYLMENYRSTTNIVKLAQRIIDGGTTDDDDDDDDLQQQQPNMKAMRDQGPAPRIVSHADSKAEATWVISTIQTQLLNNNHPTTPPPPSSIAIIYRTNSQSRILEETCIKQNLPYILRGNAPTFYARREIQDCLCFFKVLRNGWDAAAFKRVVKTPGGRGLGEKSMEEFEVYRERVEEEMKGGRLSRWEVLLSLSRGVDDDNATNDSSSSSSNNNIPHLSPKGIMSTRTINRVIPFAIEMNALVEKAKRSSLTELLQYIAKMLKDHLSSISVSDREFVDRWSNVMELCQASEKYEGICLGSDDDKTERDGTRMTGDGRGNERDDNNISPLHRFLDDVELLTDIDSSSPSSSPPTTPPVELMTIHSSKGMEFDAVFLVGNEDGVLPTQRSINDGGDALDEERRLMYVAMTRAKTNLFLTWRREHAVYYGETGFKIVTAERSRFLDGLVTKKKKKKGVEEAGMTRVVKKKKKVIQKRRIDDVINYERNDQSLTNQRRRQRRVESRNISSSHHQSSSHRINNNHYAMTTTSPPQPDIDSTLIYPVGSSVMHTVYGSGKVLPPRRRQNEMDDDDDGSSSLTKRTAMEPMVRVLFDDGMEIELKMMSSGLRRLYNK